MSNILMSGIFYKRSKWLHNWNLRYFELYKNKLIYKHNIQDNKTYIIKLNRNIIEYNMDDSMIKINKKFYFHFENINQLKLFLKLINYN